ncbi:outer membrane beta-barrel protein [Winogradskyella sp. PG-2]|uniref:outer membrane beta-barrel protein n=1 Tax=Winogradskyella sp. PG-2 TaxID=754409 RepID=UPI00045862C3|nr:outer membrane beta-barrel protein [Winogradskyella sp. PG-2]BAO77116.1 hypothetical protein WPG_2886 [Winogradskyella sp. PG-2]
MKLFLAIIGVVFFSSIIEAQTEFGVKGGLNFTFYKVTEADFGTNPDIEIGLYAGLFADFEIENDFHIQPELLYIGVNDFKFLKHLYI